MTRLIPILILCLLPLGPALAERALAPAGPAPAAATEKRVALVIGNAAYKDTPLKNPVNDARAVAAKLRGLGFDVIERHDLTQKQIGRALSEFRSKLAPGGAALFFYAGHGLQVGGVNYLPAVDADIGAEEDVPTQSIDVNKVLAVMEGGKTRVNLVFLDACRNNPYARGFRSAGEGLAKVNAPTGTLLFYATRPGSVAADGEGGNGLYTRNLLAAMDVPGLTVEQVQKRVAAGVKQGSKGRQEPWMEGLIEGDFYFRRDGATAQSAAPPAALPSPAAAVAAPPAQDKAGVETEFWASIRDSRDPADYAAYLRQYPEGAFRPLAENRLRQIRAARGNLALSSAPAPGPDVIASTQRPRPPHPTFTFYNGNRFNDPASRRRWVHEDADTWHEVYPDGQVTVLKVVERMRLDGVPGVRLRKQDAPEQEVFIPDPGFGSRRLMWRGGPQAGWIYIGDLRPE